MAVLSGDLHCYNPDRCKEHKRRLGFWVFSTLGRPCYWYSQLQDIRLCVFLYLSCLYWPCSEKQLGNGKTEKQTFRWLAKQKRPLNSYWSWSYGYRPFSFFYFLYFFTVASWLSLTAQLFLRHNQIHSHCGTWLHFSYYRPERKHAKVAISRPGRTGFWAC